MHIYNIIYNRWLLGKSKLNVVERIMLTPSNLDSQLNELREIMKNHVILPLGKHMSLFPPPYISNDSEIVVVETSRLNRLNVSQNVINVDAGVSYKKFINYCFKEDLYPPMSFPISVFESLGGLYSTGLLNSWYKMPLESFLLNKNIFPHSNTIYNNFGRDGLVLNLSIKCYPLEADTPICIKLDFKDVNQIFSLRKKIFLKYRVFPRMIIGYLTDDILEIFINLSYKLYKNFIKMFGKDNVDSLSPLYKLPDLYPDIPTNSTNNKKIIYLVNVGDDNFFKKLLKKQCKTLYIDLLKNIAIVDCLIDLKRYIRKVIIEDEFFVEVEYRDV